MKPGSFVAAMAISWMLSACGSVREGTPHDAGLSTGAGGAGGTSSQSGGRPGTGGLAGQGGGTNGSGAASVDIDASRDASLVDGKTPSSGDATDGSLDGGSVESGSSGIADAGGIPARDAATGADAGPASCSPGARRCDANVPQVCTASGTWSSEAPCSGSPCVGGYCFGCVVGLRVCSGQVPQFCNDAGLWRNAPACADQACVAGQCSGICSPGSTRCGVANDPQRCSALGQWILLSPCPPEAPSCVDGTCIAPG